MSAHADETTTELMFEPRIRPFHRRAFFESFGFMRGELDLTPARIQVDERDVPVLSTSGPNDRGVIGGIHEIIEVGHALVGYLRQGQRHLAVVHVG